MSQQDEEDLFAQQVASILRRLPRRKRALMKINIQQMLYQAEFENPGGNPDSAIEGREPPENILPQPGYYNFN